MVFTPEGVKASVTNVVQVGAAAELATSVWAVFQRSTSRMVTPYANP